MSVTLESIYKLGSSASDIDGWLSLVTPFALKIDYSFSEAFKVFVKSFNIPKTDSNLVSVAYMNETLNIPSPPKRNKTPLVVKFRMDKCWSVYSMLMKWKNAITDDFNGVTIPVGSELFSNYSSVLMLQANETDTENYPFWTFANAYPVSLSEVSMSQDSVGTPLECTVDFAYSRIDFHIGKEDKLSGGFISHR